MVNTFAWSLIFGEQVNIVRRLVDRIPKSMLNEGANSLKYLSFRNWESRLKTNISYEVPVEKVFIENEKINTLFVFSLKNFLKIVWKTKLLTFTLSQIF